MPQNDPKQAGKPGDTDSLHRHRSLEEWLSRHDYEFIRIKESLVELRDGQERNDRAIRGENGIRMGLIEQVRLIDRDTEQRKRERDQVDEQIEDIVKQVNEIVKSIQPLLFQAKIINWFALVLGASVFALIWSIIIGSVQILVP